MLNTTNASSAAALVNVNTDALKQLVERIGTSETLFKHLVNYAIENYMKLTNTTATATATTTAITNEESKTQDVMTTVRSSSWGSLMIATLLRLHEMNNQQVSPR